MISGGGSVTVNGETVAIRTGDAIPVDVGQTRAIRSSQTALELMVVGVARDMAAKRNLHGSACRRRPVRRALLCGMAAAAIAFQGQAQQPISAADWPHYGRDAGGMRFSPLKQISPANVAGLKLAWTYHMRPVGAPPPPPPPGSPEIKAGPARSGFAPSEATPIVIGSVMYLPTPYGRVVALDADTGRELWVYKVPGNDQPATRGVAWWPGTNGVRPRCCSARASAS